ncbi:hypothetical protein EVAR_21353_1 [Eumeta japonica]|uniref:Uncharacterized protein n=1 Tax=Eumeta variegata TaxID=151549 RepID=A0A4C1YG21_EUMVA|nr:hypothetical protein EVAR_21353_1 [Eumeta japonica]
MLQHASKEYRIQAVTALGARSVTDRTLDLRCGSVQGVLVQILCEKSNCIRLVHTARKWLTDDGSVGLNTNSTPARVTEEGLLMELSNFQLRYQTLKANHGQRVFHDNINKSKHGWDMLFRYRVPAYLLAPSSDQFNYTILLYSHQSSTTVIDRFLKMKGHKQRIRRSQKNMLQPRSKREAVSLATSAAAAASALPCCNTPDGN